MPQAFPVLKKKASFLPRFERSLGATPTVPGRAIVPKLAAPSKVPAVPGWASMEGPQNIAAAPPADALGNYLGELTDDPIYRAAQKTYENSREMGQRTLLADPINRLIMGSGYDPRNFTGRLPQASIDLANKYLDPAAIEAANRDPYTTKAQIEHGFGQALAGVPTNLAMRGLERSGSSAIIGDRLTRDRGQQEKQALDQLLAGIDTANQNWLGFEEQASNTFRSAGEDVASRLAQIAGYHDSIAAPQPAAAAPKAPAAAKVSPTTKKVLKKVQASSALKLSPWQVAMRSKRLI